MIRGAGETEYSSRFINGFVSIACCEQFKSWFARVPSLSLRQILKEGQLIHTPQRITSHSYKGSFATFLIQFNFTIISMQIYIYKEKGNATSTTSTKPPSVALINLSFSFLLLLVCGQRPAGNITQIQWSFTPQWCMGFKHHQRQLYNKYIDDNFSQRTMMRLQTHHTTQCSRKTPPIIWTHGREGGCGQILLAPPHLE